MLFRLVFNSFLAALLLSSSFVLLSVQAQEESPVLDQGTQPSSDTTSSGLGSSNWNSVPDASSPASSADYIPGNSSRAQDTPSQSMPPEAPSFQPTQSPAYQSYAQPQNNQYSDYSNSYSGSQSQGLGQSQWQNPNSTNQYNYSQPQNSYNYNSANSGNLQGQVAQQNYQQNNQQPTQTNNYNSGLSTLGRVLGGTAMMAAPMLGMMMMSRMYSPYGYGMPYGGYGTPFGGYRSPYGYGMPYGGYGMPYGYGMGGLGYGGLGSLLRL